MQFTVSRYKIQDTVKIKNEVQDTENQTVDVICFCSNSEFQWSKNMAQCYLFLFEQWISMVKKQGTMLFVFVRTVNFNGQKTRHNKPVWIK